MNETNSVERRWLRKLREYLSAHGRDLAAGTPALVAGAALIVFGVRAVFAPEEALAQVYKAEAARSLVAGRYAKAEVCLERLIQTEGPTPQYRYELAKALDGRGEHDRAASIRRTLAPLNRMGYPPAHLDQARALLARKDRTPSVLREIEAHLRRAASHDADGDQATMLLAQFCAATGRAGAADDLLLAASHRHPEFFLLMAASARSRKDEAQARRHTAKAWEIFHARVLSRSKATDDYLFAAQAALLVNESAQAEAVLEEGLKQTSSPRCHRALAHVLATRAAALDGTVADGPGGKLALIERGLSYNPDDPLLLNQLAALMRTKGIESARARKALTGLLAHGKSAPWAHLLLGVDAEDQGHAREARMHFEQAYRSAPQLPEVANNLAWVLAHNDPPELDRALALVETALRARPQNPHFRDTRGQILVKLGRWTDAIPDLEGALASRPNQSELHTALARSYDELGSTALAAEHRRLAAHPVGVGSRPTPVATPLED